jgi:hypothetical protein
MPQCTPPPSITIKEKKENKKLLLFFIDFNVGILAENIAKSQ